MHNIKTKRWIRAIGFVLCVVILVGFCNAAFVAPSTDERMMLHEMYTENRNIDLAFLGASQANRGFDPVVFDKKLGINTFNIGSSGQKLDDSYYLLKETYKYHKLKYCILIPSYVMFETTEYTDDRRYSFALYDNYRPSQNRKDYFNAVFDETTRLSALIPMLRPKTSNVIQNISRRMSKAYRTYDYALLQQEKEWYAGQGFVCTDYEGYNDNLAAFTWDKNAIRNHDLLYFDKIVELCRRNETKLMMITPPMPPTALKEIGNYNEVLTFYQSLSEKYSLLLIDFVTIDPAIYTATDADFYDFAHLNDKGAERFSAIAAEVLSDYLQKNP